MTSPRARVRADGLPPGAILVDLDGTVWRLLQDGRAEEVLPPGHPRPGAAHATATSEAANWRG